MINKASFFLFSSWFISLVSTMGSLFFSEIMLYPPCVLCWYQRICMYPLSLILLLGLFPISKMVIRYALPLAGVGWTIAFYHNLLYYKILPSFASPCVKGISCTSVFINWLGFITIPLLSLTAFSLIIVSLLFSLRNFEHEK
jgi:disulfide bond formation protein DsbB